MASCYKVAASTILYAFLVASRLHILLLSQRVFIESDQIRYTVSSFGCGIPTVSIFDRHCSQIR